MSLTFSYLLVNRPNPSIPLGGRWVQPRTLIPVTFIGPGGTWLNEGLLDTGADETVLPDSASVLLGIDLTNAPSGTATLYGGQSLAVRYAEVTVRLANQHEQREWTAWVAFANVGQRRALLGFAGFLQYFTATFHGDRELVELTVNALYSGT